MADALIFDIDGTLLDSVDLHAKAWQEAFEHFGHTIDFPIIRSQIGKGGDQILPVFLSDEERKNYGKKLEEYRADLFKRKFLPEVKSFPCVRELFEKVISSGQKVALASSARGDELKIYEQIANIEDLVHAETSSADAEKSKPHPDIFEAAVERLGNLDPAKIVAIGDTPYDAEASAKAGLKPVGVLCGGFAEQDLRKAGCIAIYRDPEDLLKNYDHSPLAK